jgi:membrane fusion protein (multidrug efflux system)
MSMAATFSRTLRSLEADGRHRWAGQVLVLALSGAWVAWFLLGRVTVYEVTEQGRLEVVSAAHPVAAPVSGQVEKSKLRIGQEVSAGEVLVKLDARDLQLDIEKLQTRRDALRASRKAVEGRIRAESQTLTALQEARHAAGPELRAKLAAAEVSAYDAQSRAERAATLAPRRYVSPEHYGRAKTEARVTQLAADELSCAIPRSEKDRWVEECKCEARLAELRGDAVRLDGEIATAGAALRRLEHEAALRLIRAPVAGRVGAAADFRVGSFVRAGDKLGAVIPAGETRVVAWFPAAAVGRIHSGQPARLRLEGFPWTQYGTLPATVAEVGNEASAGRIRVELRLASGVASAIPVEHGLPGSAEVEIERVAPAVLVLRAAGQFLGVKRSPQTSGSQQAGP